MCSTSSATEHELPQLRRASDPSQPPSRNSPTSTSPQTSCSSRSSTRTPPARHGRASSTSLPAGLPVVSRVALLIVDIRYPSRVDTNSLPTAYLNRPYQVRDRRPLRLRPLCQCSASIQKPHPHIRCDLPAQGAGWACSCTGFPLGAFECYEGYGEVGLMHSASLMVRQILVRTAGACMDPAEVSWRRRIRCDCDRVLSIENLMRFQSTCARRESCVRSPPYLSFILHQ
jgi:hypothetical protein